MPEDKSLIDISGSLVNIDTKGFNEPAKLLVEKLSNAVGLWYQPRRTIRQAKADAEAARIRALSTIEVSDIEQRARHRLEYENVKHQRNMESITLKALEYIPETAERVGDVSDDWIAFFFDKARLVSDEQMHVLWAKVLAGEAEKPGSISKHTVAIVSRISRKEANDFTELCRYTWRLDEELYLVAPHYMNMVSHNEHRLSLTHGTTIHLSDIGLISYQSGLGNGFSYGGNGPSAVCAYFDRRAIVSFTNGRTLPLGNVLLTSTGRQLCAFAEPTPVDDFFEHVVAFWKMQGLSVDIL